MVGRWFFLAVVAIGLVAIVRAPHGAPAATVTQSCPAADVVEAQLSWAAPPDGTQQLSLDVSLAPVFVAAAMHSTALQPAATSSTIPALPLGVKLYYRVLAQAPDGAHTVASGSFTTSCGDAAPNSTARAGA